MGGPVEKAEGGKVYTFLEYLHVSMEGWKRKYVHIHVTTVILFLLVVYSKDGPVVQAEGSKVYTGL